MRRAGPIIGLRLRCSPGPSDRSCGGDTLSGAGRYTGTRDAAAHRVHRRGAFMPPRAGRRAFSHRGRWIVADIDIEKKRDRRWWIWLVALALLALLVWVIAEAFGGSDEAQEGESALRAPAMAPAVEAPAPVLVVDPAVPAPAVAAYIAHVRQNEARTGGDHLYTAEAIVRMGSALRELVQAHRGLSPAAVARAERFYALASALAASPDSMRMHADWVSEAATSAAEVMEGLAAEVAGPVPELREQVREVRAAADAIAPRRDLLQQQQNVSAFFREAADAMAMLVNPRP